LAPVSRLPADKSTGIKGIDSP